MNRQLSSSRPAPGDLVVVQEFVNTLDMESGQDRLADPAKLRAWLQDFGLLADGGPMDHRDHQRALALREALRALLIGNTRGEGAGAAAGELNDAARASPLLVTFDAAGAAHLQSAGKGVDGALGKLLGIVFESMANGSWPRLKACQGDHCHWVFYDHSKNQSGAWCSMAVCGSREKTRAYRRRQAARGDQGSAL